MRSLLIGADGQVGRALLGRLAAHGEVVATTRSGRLPDGSACLALDVCDPAAIRAAVGGSAADLVVNAAAYTAVDLAEQQAELAFAVNAAAPEVLARACAQRSVQFVHLSTDYVFPGTGSRPLQEDDPVGPLSVYGASKLAGEHAVRAAGGRCKIFRLSWVYSPHCKNFLLTVLRLAATRPELRMVADQCGAPTPAAWVAEAIVRAVVTQPERSGTWHLASSGQTSWHGFAQQIVDEALRVGILARPISVCAIRTADYPVAAVRPAYSVLDGARFEQDFGFRLPDWTVGVPEVVGALLESAP